MRIANSGSTQRMIDIEDIRIPWSDSPFLDALLERANLPKDEEAAIRSFAKDGFLVIDLADDGDFDRIAQQIIDGCRALPDSDFRVQDAWDRVSAVRELATHPTVLAILESLYRSSPIPMQTLNFRRGTEQRAHSDDFHFSCHPKGFMCGVWVALEPIDANNGPLEYYPGSHRLPVLDLSHIGRAGSQQRDIELYPEYEEMIQALIRGAKLERREMHLRPGQAVIWASNLLHGGSPIGDPSRTRHSQVTHYYFDRSIYYQPQHSDPTAGRVHRLDVTDLRTGQRVEQQYAGERFQTQNALQRMADRIGVLNAIRLWRRKRLRRG